MSISDHFTKLQQFADTTQQQQKNILNDILIKGQQDIEGLRPKLPKDLHPIFECGVKSQAAVQNFNTSLSSIL